MQTDNIKVSIEASDGRPLRYYSHEGKTYIESHENREYQIRIKNLTDKRVKAVVSVDSLNIISGKPATNDPAETGYLLNAYEEQILKGYRVDDDTVAAFTFVKREKSYATEMGSGTGNGVIAVRAYSEKEKPEDVAKIWRDLYEKERNRPREKEYVPYDRPYPVYPWRPYWERPYWSDVWCGGYVSTSTTSVIPSQDNVTSSSVMYNATVNNVGELRGVSLTASCMQSDVNQSIKGSDIAAASNLVDENPFSMGSAFGAAIKDSVKTVEFEVGKLLAEVNVYYAAIEGLKALGVNVDRIKTVAFPEPFKKTYCAVPSGWKR